jgi:methyl-accepting chemotaxis protein
VASADVPTVASVLENHGARIKADIVLLVDLDGTVTADTLRGRMVGRPFPFAALLHQADAQGEASATVSLGGRPHQFVIVPVLAPRRIAWVAAGFAIDERVLQDVRSLTSLEVSLWSASGMISTLSPAKREDSGDDYAELRVPLRTGDRSQVNALLQRSLADAQRPFLNLELQIFALSAVLLVLAVIAAVLFARSVSRPLTVLAEGAGRIERGDYVSPIIVEQGDEIGRLGTAFNQMQSAIAAREEQIMFQATHDALTGLPNRTLFLDRIAQAITSATSC